ncbi:glycosyltransferase family 39 protein [Defluviimonas sp. WL0050]|uniref:Glycosyltransferase family 39 protein n=1 Tax=Albidovulum litorale TaxID=2984134 RepID=A0ABT2ZRT8_9RHOB|nr:glycosyltransferase family 39 protein [Defluviimonas sp. WL0050]MCV2873757.1 glycosyltransferase family 39 protein [Defluviimonas sp. WL0050]
MQRDGTITTGLWFGIFCAYFAVQAILRISVLGPALELDEAEAFWFSRDLALGYGAQPPLYFWLQWIAFELFGQSVIGLTVLKNLILAATSVAVFAVFRPFVPPAIAGAAALSLGLLPEISWEAQRALTHSALVLLMSALTLLAVRRAMEDGRWGSCVLLGLTLGFGMLSKHNYHLLWVAIALAVVTDRRMRAAMNWPRLLLSAAIAVLMVLPYVYWVIGHPERATGSVQKLGLTDFGFFAARLQGIADLVSMLVGFFALAILWLAPAVILKRKHLRPESSDQARFLCRVVVSAFIIVLLLVVVGGVTNIRGRWIMPLLWPAVPLFVVALWPLLSARGRQYLTVSFGALWLVVMAALTMVTSYRDADFRMAYTQLPENLPIICAQTWVLGNLAMIAPDRPVYMVSDDDIPTGEAILIAPVGGMAQLTRDLGYGQDVTVAPLDLGPAKLSRVFEYAVID